MTRAFSLLVVRCSLFVVAILPSSCGTLVDAPISSDKHPPPPDAVFAPVVQEGIREVALNLARALSDTEVRNGLLNILTRSGVHEGKVHLQRFLTARGREWGELVGARSSSSVSWVESVQSLPELEMYIPVPSHKGWDGDRDLVVLPFPESDAELGRNGGVLRGYAIGGEELELSINTIPSRPVLVLVPVEDRDVFGEDGVSSPVIAGPSLIPGDSTAGGWSCGPITAGHDKIYACRVDITNISQYEPWPMGQPEITIAAGHLDLVTGVLYPGAGCNADNQSGARFYDQNTDTWWGHAFVTTNTALSGGSTGNRKPVLWVWEDDSGDKCTFNPEGQGYDWMNYTTGIGTSVFIAGIATLNPVVVSIAAVLLVPIAFALNADDAIGVVGVQPGGDPTINPKPILLKPGATINVVGSMLFESFP